MRTHWQLVLVAAIVAAAVVSAVADDDNSAAFTDILDYYDNANVGPQPDGRVVVTTNQVLDPAGTHVEFPGRPNDCAFSPDGSIIAVADAWGGRVLIVDGATGAERQSIALEGDVPGYSGIVFSADGQRLFVSGSRNLIWRLVRGADGSWALEEAMYLGDHVTPVGISWSRDGERLLVCFNRLNQVVAIDPASGEVLQTAEVGVAPFAAVEGPGGKIYVTNWGGRLPAAGDVTEPSGNAGQVVVDPFTRVASLGSVSIVDSARFEETGQIEVGLHPCEMALSPDDKTLYVACANSDVIHVIDTATDDVRDTIDVKPIRELPFGCAPNAVALAPNGATLYASLGTNNAIAVISTRTGVVRGYVPVGWYPGGLDVSPDGRSIAVCNIKGIGSRNPVDPKGFNSHHYLGSLSLLETTSVVRTLGSLTRRTLENNRMTAALAHLGPPRPGIAPVPLPERHGEPSTLEHVIYIIKENRTYDQVLGDMPEGNGDPALCQYGEEISPNHHALAREFALLDNFYCCGTLSADGHQWTDSGYATDYIEKGFRGWPRSYPYDGGDAMAYSPGGFIWDNALSHGKTVRVYGEFVQAHIQSGATWSDFYKDWLEGTSEFEVTATPKIDSLEGLICPTFIGFPQTVPEVYRAREFLKEYQQFLAEDRLPNLMILLLPCDHFSGSATLPTIPAQMADNDYALGQIVEAVSRSKAWPKTAIFVTEDDPQNGIDHVDGRRTLGYVISPYTPRGTVVSKNYNQTSMLKTMELILGLPPMTQLDLLASPMEACFGDRADLRPYRAKEPNIPLDTMPEATAMDPRTRAWWDLYCAQPFDQEDIGDEMTLNLCLWHLTHGPDVPYPIYEYGRVDQIEEYEQFVEAHPHLFEPIT